MYNPEEHHQSIKFQQNEIVNRIKNLVMVERIYYLKRIESSSFRIEIIVLISNKYKKTLAELTPILNVILSGYPNYWHRVFHAHQVKEGLKKGNLFFYNTCISENLLYADPTSDFILFPATFDIKNILSKAKQNFKKGIDKIQAFKDGAEFYFEKGNYSQTAFMMHQQIEMAYRTIELFTMGKDKITHSIRVHQDCVRSYMPDLGNVFNESDAMDEKLVFHLDEAYLKVRYEDDYKMNREKVLKIKDKGDFVCEKITEIYEEVVTDFEKRHVIKNPIPEEHSVIPEEIIRITYSPPTIQDQYMETIIKQILTYSGIERIYSFGKRTHTLDQSGLLFTQENKLTTRTHYDLLVITADNIQQELHNLQGQLNKTPDERITVLLLTHTRAEINNSLAEKNRFFSKILRDAELVYNNNNVLYEWEILDFEGKKYSSAELDPFLDNWYNRYWNAKGLIDSAGVIMDMECLLVQVSMFNQALEQLCIGLIDLFLGYHPNRRSLNHLFDICCSFTSFAEEIIPRHTKDDFEIFKVLMDGFNTMRYRGGSDVSYEEVHIIEKRCSAFLETANEFARTHIKDIKNGTKQLHASAIPL